MSMINSQRKSCKDIFNAFMVADASYDGVFEIPCIKSSKNIPNKLTSFSKAISCKEYNQWIHFYEDDYLFERIWRNPKKYLELIKRFDGVILPDFSLYRDMPLAMQIWNIYRSRAIGNWLQKNNVEIIPNIRFGDKRTYRLCCDGIEKHSVIAVGSHGNLKHVKDRDVFLEGFDYVTKNLEPRAIVIYGSAPDKYFQKYRNDGVEIVQFDSLYSASHNQEVE